MRTLSALRTGLIALSALAGVTVAAYADGGGISFSVIKAGIVIGGSARLGHAHLPGQAVFARDRRAEFGFTFGASETQFRGTVSNIHRPVGMSPASMPQATSARRSGAARRPSC